MTTLSIAAQVALVLLGVLALAGVASLLVLIRQVRRIGRRLDRELGPLLDRGKVVAGNLESITGQVRGDVERVHASVKALSDRLNQASSRMEDRIEEFNALMEVVQGEAEGVFLDTAATVRGLRAGARELANPETDTPEPDPERRGERTGRLGERERSA
ncbi:MAG: hypothetical protein RQ751_09495 [Longimicrobiales bacterium]|nr:hypothetical protein [Longimicrobiales bacterium]